MYEISIKLARNNNILYSSLRGFLDSEFSWKHSTAPAGKDF